MQKLTLPDKLAARLKACGWDGAATIDVAATAKQLRERHGLEMHDAARAFLDQFGGLTIQDKVGNATNLTPTKIKNRESRGRVSWENVELYPIGYVRDGTVILMDARGVTFTYWDHLLPLANDPVATLGRMTESLFGL